MERHARTAALVGGMVTIMFVIVALIYGESVRVAVFWGLITGIGVFAVLAIAIALFGGRLRNRA